MVKYRNADPDLPWVRNLESFIREVRSIVDGSTPFRLESPSILPKYKKDVKRPDGTVAHIYRPICVYSDIRTKVVLALACKYMLAMFDRCFHSRMFFMRNARKDAAGNWSTPDYRDCVKMASAFRKDHEGENIYVGECDIQKFYDIFNHDCILDCLDRLFGIRASLAGCGTEVFRQLRRIMEMYLDSFDFPGHVLKLNGDSQFWAREVSSRATADDPHPVCLFDWVSRESFLKCGCYGSGEELDSAIAAGKLGIPQGGSLSGIIVNVVMNVVDTDIVSTKDPGRFFARYCDDILLMHTDRDKEALLERFGELPGKLKDYELATHDGFTRNQGRRLDKYVRLKARKASRIIHARIPNGLATYADTLGGK